MLQYINIQIDLYVHAIYIPFIQNIFLLYIHVNIFIYNGRYSSYYDTYLQHPDTIIIQFHEVKGKKNIHIFSYIL